MSLQDIQALVSPPPMVPKLEAKEDNIRDIKLQLLDQANQRMPAAQLPPLSQVELEQTEDCDCCGEPKEVYSTRNFSKL